MLAFFLRRGMPALPAVFLFFSAMFLVACERSAAPIPAQGVDTARQVADVSGLQPIQSPSDDLQYRLLTLENELQVLLISDPDTPKAAASLDVMVGSGDNPPGRGGLAHFLEHMLFLGTDKYPDAAEYERYITEHGGSRNAYTSFEHTNYFFDVNAPFLPEALDRFAQFFISPRFDAQYVEREKNAVEAEYQMGLKSDSRRGLDVLQEVMNQEHPFSQFSVGSLDTLADRPDSSIRDELISFYDKHYSANVMRLAVMGSESLDELEALVSSMFSAIPNKSYTPPQIEQPLFSPGSLPMLVRVQPQATLRELQVSFPLPDYRDLYDVKPLAYLGNLVGHEGGGSLLSQLKVEGLAESLAAGSGLGWRGGSLFSVSVNLTEKGVGEYRRVLQLLFAYMDLLRSKGPQAWLYEEQSRLADLSFRFKEKVEPIHYVSALASGMHYYAPEDVLRGPYVMNRYDQEILADLLRRLTRDNALIVLSDQSVATDRVTGRYDVAYAAAVMTAEQVDELRGVVAADRLHLPAANEFIAEDVSLVDTDPNNPAVPAIKLEKGRQRIWFRQDEEFQVPRGATYINFRSPAIGENPEQTAAAVLYTSLLKDQVNEFAYPALLAGLSFDIYKHAQGISLRISGYNDKQQVLLGQLLDVMVDPSFDEQRFEDIRSDLIRQLRNSVAKRPSSQAIDDLREALLYGEWGELALIEELERLDRKALAGFVSAFWEGATAEALLYGNYQPFAAASVSAMLARVVSAEAAPELPAVKVLRLAPGESLLYGVDIPHDDALVAWYLQGRDNTWSDRAATVLTGQIMKSGFFQQLRTEQQLGYVVSAFSWPQRDVPGLVMLIQSPVADAPAVIDAMETFMQGVIGDLDGDQFERHRAALLSEIRRPDKNLWERAEFYWQSIAKKQWNFDGRDALASAVENLTMEDWKAYFEQVFLTRRHSLQVVSPGKSRKLPQDENLQRFDTATAIKEDHGVYVVD